MVCYYYCFKALINVYAKFMAKIKMESLVVMWGRKRRWKGVVVGKGLNNLVSMKVEWGWDMKRKFHWFCFPSFITISALIIEVLFL